MKAIIPWRPGAARAIPVALNATSMQVGETLSFTFAGTASALQRFRGQPATSEQVLFLKATAAVHVVIGDDSIADPTVANARLDPADGYVPFKLLCSDLSFKVIGNAGAGVLHGILAADP